MTTSEKESEVVSRTLELLLKDPAHFDSLEIAACRDELLAQAQINDDPSTAFRKLEETLSQPFSNALALEPSGTVYQQLPSHRCIGSHLSIPFHIPVSNTHEPDKTKHEQTLIHFSLGPIIGLYALTFVYTYAYMRVDVHAQYRCNRNGARCAIGSTTGTRMGALRCDTLC